MGKCEDCGTQVGDQYIVCLKCKAKRDQNKGDNGSLVDILTKLNWNIGTATKQQRLFFLHQYGDGETKRKIYAFLEKDLDKELGTMEKIKNEQDKSEK